MKEIQATHSVKLLKWTQWSDIVFDREKDYSY